MSYPKSVFVFRYSQLNSPGQSGLFSAIAAHPKVSELFAAGSYTGSTGIYSTGAGRAIMVIEGHRRGVNFAKFSHDGTKLFCGTRKVRCVKFR